MSAARFASAAPVRLTPAEVEDALKWYAGRAGGFGPHTTLYELAGALSPGAADAGLDLNPLLDDLERRTGTRFDRGRLFDGLSATSTVAELCRQVAHGADRPREFVPPPRAFDPGPEPTEPIGPPAPRVGSGPAAPPAECPWLGHARRVRRARAAVTAVPAVVAGGLLWAGGFGPVGCGATVGGAVLATAAGLATIGFYDQERRAAWDLELMRPGPRAGRAPGRSF